MVTSQASLKRDGVQDYVTIRATAIIMTAFSLFMLWYFVTTPQVTFESWNGLFSNIAMKVFTFATLVSIMLHVRIGLWQVLTDYVKAPALRAVVQFILNLIAFVYVAVGLFVLWGI
ncbi:succinate dehydrogenase, hydrophobic membrane anchor protein [Paraglaciecola sp.]|uniref:succinate dehydrogenase, hydrophobic membrane anchor protein n=1 Tax=Paraglaciecola sp. TaxID=1920173 RepID=UPI00273F23B2|nr:succinate dehydrogenase, hydrophobic membrane anchor protein [Paraglaciecola sp.]MDP5031982.1 succinate dehydrogenase, hydrophobic membrane anchor protein [Paraglaciecola sp.]